MLEPPNWPERLFSLSSVRSAKAVGRGERGRDSIAPRSLGVPPGGLTRCTWPRMTRRESHNGVRAFASPPTRLALEVPISVDLVASPVIKTHQNPFVGILRKGEIRTAANLRRVGGPIQDDSNWRRGLSRPQMVGPPGQPRVAKEEVRSETFAGPRVNGTSSGSVSSRICQARSDRRPSARSRRRFRVGSQREPFRLL